MRLRHAEPFTLLMDSHSVVQPKQTPQPLILNRLKDLFCYRDDRQKVVLVCICFYTHYTALFQPTVIELIDT